MKTFATILTVVLLSFSLISKAGDKKKTKEVKTCTFDVSMDCHSCVKKIQSNIAYEKGVKDLAVSLEDKEVKVSYRSDKTSEENLKKAIEKLGYTVKVKKDDEKKTDTDK